MLTPTPGTVTMNTSPHWDTGRENLVSTYGEKIATLSSGFFVPTIQHGVLPCLLCYGGLITGKLRAWLHHMAVSHPVFSPSPNAVRSISDGYSTHMESTVMNSQVTGEIRPKSNTSHAALTVSCFRVVKDSTMPDGTRLLQRPLSRNFRTVEEAFSFLDQCGVAGAYVVQNTLFCRDRAEQRDMDRHLFADPQA